MDVWMNEWMNGWMDGWGDSYENEQKYDNWKIKQQIF